MVPYSSYRMFSKADEAIMANDQRFWPKAAMFQPSNLSGLGWCLVDEALDALLNEARNTMSLRKTGDVCVPKMKGI